MFSPSRRIFAFNGTAFFTGALTLAGLVLFSFSHSTAQSIGGLNTTGTFGNEEINGRIFFPGGHQTGMRPVVKLRSDSTTELTALADSDGNFRFTHLRPEFYTIIVNGGDEYENAYEKVSIGSAGAVPAQGNPFDYAIPVIYQVQIYLKPKQASVLNSTPALNQTVPANVPPAARASFLHALESARLRENEKAIEQFKAAISESPSFGLAYNELGVLYLKLGQANQAAEVFARAITLGLDDFVVHLNYGIALLNMKKLAEAEEQLRQSLKKNATVSTSHYYLGFVLLTQQQFEAAEAEFKASIRNSNDRIAPAHKYLGGIYWRRKQYPLAADELERYVKLDPKAADAARIRQTVRELRLKK